MVSCTLVWGWGSGIEYNGSTFTYKFHPIIIPTDGANQVGAQLNWRYPRVPNRHVLTLL